MNKAQLAWIDDYLNHLAHERRLSAHTVKSYARDLAVLASYCEEHSLTAWNKIAHHQIQAFIASQHRKGQTGTSLQRNLSAIRGFYRYLIREKRCNSNPAQGIRAPKSSKTLPATLDTDQLSALLAIPASEPLEIRDRAIMELFYSSGLRLAELASLNIDDIQMDVQMTRVVGKGSKEREVPIGTQAIAAIEQWLNIRSGFANSDEQALFVGQHGDRLGLRSIEIRVKKWAAKLGLDLRVYPHLLRHSCASHVLESSGDLRAVQELLGHANLSTTQVYTHLNFQHLADVYDKAHPRAKK